MLASTIPRNIYTGDGATAIYSWVNWLINQASDLYVAVLSNAVPQVLTPLVLNTDYTIATPATQIGNSGGGAIILNPAGFLSGTGGNLPSGWTIVLRRSVLFYQPGVLSDQSGSAASQIESMIDYLAMQLQQLQDAMARTIQVPLDDAAPTQGVGFATARAGMLLGFDNSGNPQAMVQSSGLGAFTDSLTFVATGSEQAVPLSSPTFVPKFILNATVYATSVGSLVNLGKIPVIIGGADTATGGNNSGAYFVYINSITGAMTLHVPNAALGGGSHYVLAINYLH